MERTELDRLEQAVDREIKTRFPRGAVQRVVLRQHGDEPDIEPGELLVRVFIPAPEEPGGYPESPIADEAREALATLPAAARDDGAEPAASPVSQPQ